MKILLLTAYYFPEQAASSYLANNIREAICDKGHTIDLYTPIPTRGVSKEVREEYKKKRVEFLYNRKLIVNRFSMFNEGKNALIRAFRYTACMIMHFYYGVKAKDIDLIYLASTPPIQGILGGVLKKIKKVPFVYNLQDIFPDSLAGTGLAKKGGMLWKIGRVIENFTYRNADKIIVISEDFKKNIMAKGVPEGKIEVVYNWVDENAVKDVKREDNKLFDKYNLDRSKFYITYSGNIGLTQNMDMLLSIAKELETEEPNIQFVLIGEGAYKKNVEEIIKKDNIQNVKLLPFQPYEDISHVFSLGNVGLVISKPGVGANSVPSKTWSILSASRPVIANFDENELKSIVADNNCGIFTKAGDRKAFKDSILKLYNSPETCETMGRNGRKFIMENLTREIGTSKYVKVIEEVIKVNKK